MLRCQKCGAFLEPDSLFCTVCGTPVQKQMGVQQNNGKQKKKSDPKKILIPFLIVGSVFVVCLLVCIAAFLIFGGSIDFGAGKDSDKFSISSEEREKDEDDGKEEMEKEDKEAEEIKVETPTPTPEAVRPENVSISFCETTPYLGNYQKLSVLSCGATSYLVQEGVDHPNTPEMVVDGVEISSWQEGVAGDGLGEAIWFDFPQEQNVKYLSFKLGNWRDLNNWTGNNRPARLSITIGEYQCAVSFPDEQREFWIELSEPFPASQVRIQIDSVHKGAKWDDTCIAEIGMYGE